MRRTINFLQEFSIPLIAGVILGLLTANISEEVYHHLVDYPIFGADAVVLGHRVTLHFLINDVFMVLFFGVAAKEITEACLPGGDLNPPRKAINPLMGTLGGVLGPMAVYYALTHLLYGGTEHFDVVSHGWGIPTATDIALAWLVARLVFGSRHPAVNYLLLLAVADDAIGLGIIAIFYPNPEHPVRAAYLLVTGGGIAIAYILRRFGVRAWAPYILIGGSVSWIGLLSASLHPALALVPIVPLMPGGRRDHGLFQEEETLEDEVDRAGHHHTVPHHDDNPLTNFEHDVKLIVDLGLFFFAFANAGVAFASLNMVTAIVLTSLLVGKTIGVTLFSMIADRLGSPLPTGMSLRHLIVAGVTAGLGLTVALFVAGEAFPGNSPFQGPAKMGAVFSASAAIIALALGRLWRLRSTPATPASAQMAAHPAAE